MAAYFVLHITTQFYSSEDLISIGFYDQLKYIKIYDSAFNSIDVEVASQQGYRFLLPYLLGIFSRVFQINNFFVLCSIVILVINILIIYSFNRIIIYLNVKKNFSLIMISALIFNAYMFRPSIINPFLLNDWVFTYGLLLITTYFIKKNKITFTLRFIIMCNIKTDFTNVTI